ncbi:MAG: V-type ATP synthase subunit I [Tissierellia bacterium]|nr:V-type ATP synthase subunit I [Tissierellia bacterium]
MAIVKMSKFSLFAFDSEMEDLLQELQKFEYVHFHNLEEEEELIEEGLEAVSVPEGIVEVNEEISKVKYGLDMLAKYYERDTGIKAMIEGKATLTFEELEKKALEFDYHQVYNKLRSLSNEIEKYEEEAVKLNARKEELIHWEGLEYPLEDLYSLRQCQVFTGIIPTKMKDKLNQELLDLEYAYFEVVSEDKKNMYIFALTSKDEEEKLNDILRINAFSAIRLEGEDTPKEELNTINERLRELKDEKEKTLEKVKELAHNVPNLEILYEYLMNKKLRIAVNENFLKTEKVNVIEGYIPTEKVDDFTRIIQKTQKNAYYLEVHDAEEDDPNVPILLKNSKFVETFESLTSMYALPRYNEIDPTPLLAPFYLAFFGMMVADAGYGLITVIACFIALKVANLSESQEKFVRFFYYLGFSTTIWGLIFGSFLGGIVPIPGLMDPANEYQKLLIMSIVFGLIHLYFALGIKAYMSIREGKYLDALYDVGFWYMALSGGIVFLLTIVISLPPVVGTISKAVLIIGAVGIVLTNGRSAKSAGGKLAAGLYELYGISSYVGDFVSYSRLMALGLSGGFIASAINMMVEMLIGLGVVGYVAGIVVFVVGQLFNIFLSLLSAYVHTIRLTYVEFFGKFYEGGGKAFNIFRSKPKYINLK